MAAPLTADEVAAHMGVDPAALSPADRTHLDASVAACISMLPRIVPRLRPPPVFGDDVPWPDDIHQGAVQLAARLFARRNSPTGVAGFSEVTGGASYVARYDADLERLFGIGSWGPPVCR